MYIHVGAESAQNIHWYGRARMQETIPALYHIAEASKLPVCTQHVERQRYYSYLLAITIPHPHNTAPHMMHRHDGCSRPASP